MMKEASGNGVTRNPRRLHSHHDRTWTEMVQEEPVVWLAIAAAAGFVLGGGARQAGGLTILTLLGQIVVRETLGESVSLDDIFAE